jgi:hypothetical protein
MTNLTTRRRLLAHAPAAAAMALPTAAIVLPSHATALPAHLDVQRVKGLAEMLERLEGMPADQANVVLKAITDCIECSIDTRAHDAELMTLGPELDEAYAESLHDDDHSGNKLYAMIDKILSYRPLTREGLKLQCKALVMDGANDLDWRVAKFISNFVIYFGMEVPDRLMVDWLTTACPEEYEKTDEEDDEA